MRVVIPRPVLLDALKRVSATVAGRGRSVAYECVLIDTSLGKVSFATYNYEEATKVERPARVLDHGTVAVDARGLAAAVRTLRGDDVELQLKQRELQVLSGRATHRLPTLPSDALPQIPEVEGTPIQVDAGDLQQLLGMCAFAISPEQHKFALHGARWVVHDGKLDMIASDGRRMARAACPADGELEPTLVPRAVINLARAALATGPDDYVCIVVSGSHIAFHLTFDEGEASDVLIGRRVHGNFPDLDGDAGAVLRRPEQPLWWHFGVDELSAVLVSASVVHDRAFQGAHLTFLREWLNVSARAESGGQRSTDEAGIAKGCGEAAMIGMNAAFLREALQACPSLLVRLELHPAPLTEQQPLHLVPIGEADGHPVLGWRNSWVVTQMPITLEAAAAAKARVSA